MPQIQTVGELQRLLGAIRQGNCVFVGYQPPHAMIAEGNVLYDVPTGHLIPELMKVAAGESSDNSAATEAR